jgi:hypothetical protein
MFPGEVIIVIDIGLDINEQLYCDFQFCFSILPYALEFLIFYYHIVVLGVHCDIYKSSHNVS